MELTSQQLTALKTIHILGAVCGVGEDPVLLPLIKTGLVKQTDADFYALTADGNGALRAASHRCGACGMFADIDPAFHTRRYAHAPWYCSGEQTFTWDVTTSDWVIS